MQQWRYVRKFGSGNYDGFLFNPWGVCVHRDLAFISENMGHRVSVFSRDGQLFAHGEAEDLAQDSSSTLVKYACRVIVRCSSQTATIIGFKYLMCMASL